MRIVIGRTYETIEDPVVVCEQLLIDRGVGDDANFFDPPHPEAITLKEIMGVEQPKSYDYDVAWESALALLKDIHESEKTIIVYTDYDADGVTGGTIMWEALHMLGFRVFPYIPARSEGYGFSKQGIDHVIAEHNPALIISVDHGIVAHEMVSYIKQEGVHVIVTDHHHMQDDHPPADAVFHTTSVSGAGVAYFFAKELVSEMNHVVGHAKIKAMFHDEYCALAGIGIIADLIPLVGVSRSVVRAGLNALPRTKRKGLRELMVRSGIDTRKPISTYHVGFQIAPRINAFGRLDHAMDALRLLCTSSTDKAVELASQAELINTKRQSLVQQCVQEALEMVDPEDKIIVVKSSQWEEGIIGLIASRLMQTYYKPVIALAMGESTSKASVRSIDGVHITNFLYDLKEYLVDMGGHAMAGGFTIHTDGIEDFEEAVKSKAEKEITPDMLVPSYYVDVAMPVEMATAELARLLATCEPFGMGFKEPIFQSRVHVKGVRNMGATGNHVKLQVSGELSSSSLDVVCFGASEEVKNIRSGDAVTLMYTLSMNEWNGTSSVQAILKQLL